MIKHIFWTSWSSPCFHQQLPDWIFFLPFHLTSWPSLFSLLLLSSSPPPFLISCQRWGPLLASSWSPEHPQSKAHLKRDTWKKNTKYKVSLSTWKHLWALFQLLQEFIRGKDHLGLQMKTWDMLSHILLTILTISPTFWCLDKLDMATTTLNTFCF